MLYKRKLSSGKPNKIWWCRFEINTQEVRRSTGTTNRRKAEQFEERLRSEIWEEIRLGRKPNYTWDDAAYRWLTEVTKRSLDIDKDIIKWCKPHLEGKPLREITRPFLIKLQAIKADESSKSSANRYLALIRSILNKAKNDWEWIDAVPNVPTFRLERPEPRWITREDFETLCDLLPPHQAAMARFAVATGLRQSNVTGLVWQRVDLHRKCAWIPSSQAKGKKAIPVPLNKEAMNVLFAEKGRHKTFVFTYKGDPITQVNTKAWRKAVVKAEIAPFRWHDLRHTWASWHVQAGTPLHALQQLGGWCSYEMVLRYAHLAPDHLSGFAENVVDSRYKNRHTGKVIPFGK